ncbi:MAG: hypothetical protein HUU54_04630 [Ignavibacteriaceae bacterium]|nr:hypothetical protein [Ignavibacteriaceae bacterium]
MLEFLLISCRQIPNEYKEYLHEYSVPVEYREVFPIHGEGRLKIPEIISREQAKEDVLMMEYLIRTSYAGYEYWITKGVDFNAFYQGIFENLDKNDSVTTYDLEKELSNIFNNIYDGHIALGGRVHNWAYKHKAAYFCDIIVEKENDGTYKVIDSKNPSVKEGDTFTQVNPEQFLFRTLSSERVKQYLIGKISPVNVYAQKLSFNDKEIEIYFRKSRLMYSEFKDPKPFYIYRLNNIPVIRVTSSADHLYPEMLKFMEAGNELKNEKTLILNLFYHGGGSSYYPQTFMKNLNGNSDWDINWAMTTSPAITEYFAKIDISSIKDISPQYKNWIKINSDKFEDYKRKPVKDWEFGAASGAGKKGTYEGRLIILTNRRILSAGEGMIGASQSVKNRIIIGENTGGVAQFSDLCEFYLPNSKFILRLPRQFLIIPALEECLGYIPDYWLDTNQPVEEVMRWLENRNSYQFRYGEPFNEFLKKNNYANVLPEKFSIVPPSVGIPDELKKFSGKWFGVADGILDNILIVEKIINRHEAEVIYSWGVAFQWGVGTPGWQRYTASIENGILTIRDKKQQVKITYSFNQDGTLNSVYERPGAISKTTLMRMN